MKYSYLQIGQSNVFCGEGIKRPESLYLMGSVLLVCNTVQLWAVLVTSCESHVENGSMGRFLVLWNQQKISEATIFSIVTPLGLTNSEKNVTSRLVSNRKFLLFSPVGKF